MTTLLLEPATMKWCSLAAELQSRNTNNISLHINSIHSQDSWSKHSDNSYEELPVFLRQHATFLMLCKKFFSKEFVRIGSNPTYIRSKAIDKKSMRPGKSLASVLCLLLSALTLLVRWEEHLARKIPVQRYTVWNKWRTEILAANGHKDRGWYFYRTKRPHHCTEVRNAVVISQKLV